MQTAPKRHLVSLIPLGRNMNRKNDTTVILTAAVEQLKKILAGYDAALRNKSLDLRVPVKNVMENFRSALDYMAHDIYEACCQPVRKADGQPDPKNIYFPYGRNETDFKSGVGSSPCLASLLPPRPSIHCSFLSSHSQRATIGFTICAQFLTKKSTIDSRSRCEPKAKIIRFRASMAVSQSRLIIRMLKLFQRQVLSRSSAYQQNFIKMASGRLHQVN